MIRNRLIALNEEVIQKEEYEAAGFVSLWIQQLRTELNQNNRTKIGLSIHIEKIFKKLSFKITKF